MSSPQSELPSLTGSQPRSLLAPGPKGLPFFGSLFDAQRDPLALFEAVVREHGDTALMRFGPYRMVLINRPEDIRHVFVENREGYKKSPSYDNLRLALGMGLINSDDPLWRRQRKLVQPAFNRERLASFVKTMSSLSYETAESWRDVDRPVDVPNAMMHLTLRVVGHTLLGAEFAGRTAEQCERVVERMMEYCRGTETNMLIPHWWPTRARARAKAAVLDLDTTVFALLAERRHASARRDDLVNNLLTATDETGTEHMTDRQVRDELMTLIMAGHETTANALAWTWYLLSQHPAVADRVAREGAEVLGDREARLEDLPRLAYTEAVVKESMRIYPPVWIFDRQALRDDVVGGFRVKKGWIVAASPWTMHRNPGFYPDPEAFRPERFLEGDASTKYNYIPFGVGPRICIGNAFAMMELKIVLAILAARYRLTRSDGPAPVPEPSVSLRIRGKGSLMMSVERR